MLSQEPVTNAMYANLQGSHGDYDQILHEPLLSDPLALNKPFLSMEGLRLRKDRGRVNHKAQNEV